MDTSLLAGIAKLDNPKPISEWNSYSSDVKIPTMNFVLDKDDPAFLSKEIGDKLYDLSNSLVTDRRGNVYREISKSIYSVREILPVSKLLHNSSVNDLFVLNASLNLFFEGLNVLTFSPFPLPYLFEMKCQINLALLGSEIVFDSTNKPSLPKIKTDDNKPYDAFYMSVAEKIPIKRLFLPSFNQTDLSFRWKTIIDKFNKDNTERVGLIYLEEDTYGYTNEYSERNVNYDILFFEVALKSLSLLNEGGSIIIKMFNFANRFAADLFYLMKYMFRNIIITKPSTTEGVDIEYYFVAKDFKFLEYSTIRREIDLVLDNIAKLYVKSDGENIPLYSFVSNSIIDVNYMRWLIENNDKIGAWVLLHLESLNKAIEDRKNGYVETHSVLNLDHVSFRQALDLSERSTLQRLYPFTTNDIIVDDTVIANMTNTGQLSSNMIQLTNIDPDTGSIALYLTLDYLCKEMIKLPVFVPLLNSPKIKMQSDIQKERNLKFTLRPWLVLLYYIGDITEIITTENRIDDILQRRPWTSSEIIGQFSSITINPKDLFTQLIPFQPVLKQAFAYYSNSQVLNTIRYKISSLNNLRFRLSFDINKLQYALMENSDFNFIKSGLIDEYGLTNLLKEEEIDQITEQSQLINIINNQEFVKRAVSYASLTSFGSGLMNELSVPQLYLTYFPQLEYFASSLNRHASNWCSANPADVKLGSLGNFFGDVSKISHPIYQKIELALAFPPRNSHITLMALTRCVELIKSVPENMKLGIIFIYDTAVSDDEMAERTGAFETNRTYDILPLMKNIDVFNMFTGETPINQSLKAICIKTKSYFFQW